MRHLKTLAIAIAATAFMAPSASQAAVTVGSNLAGAGADNLPGYCPAGGTCTGTNLSLPASSAAADGLTSPIDGVVVRFAVKSGSAGNPVTLRVLRPAGGASYTAVATGATGTTNADVAEFSAQTPIKAGDSIGLDIGNSALVWATTQGANGLAWGSVNGFAGGLPDGSTETGAAQSNRELLMQARIEPDVDADGLGDETQDADVQPKDVTAPAISRAKARRNKVTYRLSEAATVTLKVRRNGKAKTFTQEGAPGKNVFARRFARKYRVKLTATDAAGNVAQPVKLRFKAKKRR